MYLDYYHTHILYINMAMKEDHLRRSFTEGRKAHHEHMERIVPSIASLSKTLTKPCSAHMVTLNPSVTAGVEPVPKMCRHLPLSC